MNIQQYIRQRASAIGIDPNIAVRVAKSEGLGPGIWQSNVRKGGVREPSYGPFQLLVGGEGTGFPAGMGNDFMQQTGLDPSDPSTVRQQVDFALGHAKNHGWSSWYGAKAAGIDNWEGIRDNVAMARPHSPTPGVTLASVPAANPAPPLSPPVEIADRPVADAGMFPAAPEAPRQGILGALADGDLKGAATLAANSKGGSFGKGLETLLKQKDGPSAQERAHATPIQSLLPSMVGADTARMANAQQIMQTLLANRHKKQVPGMSLMG